MQPMPKRPKPEEPEGMHGLTLRVDTQTIAQLDELVAQLEKQNVLVGERVTRAMALRYAVRLGIATALGKKP